MTYTNEDEFARAFRAGAGGGMFLLYGGDEYLIDAWRANISKAFSDSGAFNMQKLDGRGLDPDALYDAVETMPLMAERKCVVVEDLDLSKISPGNMEKLADVLENPNPDTLLIITGKAAFDEKSAAGKRVIKLVDKGGSAVKLGSRDAGGLVKFLCASAKRQGAVLSPDLARALLNACGNDMNTLNHEVEKVSAFSGYGEITGEHIEAVVIPRTEARVFDLSKAILAGRPARAMEILSDLFELREEPIAILSTLIMSFIDLCRARAARDSGANINQAIGRFGYKGREFRIRGAFGTRLSAGAISGALDILNRCDRGLKGSGVDNRVLLEQTVIRLLKVCA